MHTCMTKRARMHGVKTKEWCWGSAALEQLWAFLLFFFLRKNTCTRINFPNSLSTCFLFVCLFVCRYSAPSHAADKHTALMRRCWPGVIRVDGVKKLLQFFLVQRAIGEESLELVQRQLTVICRDTQRNNKHKMWNYFREKASMWHDPSFTTSLTFVPAEKKPNNRWWYNLKPSPAAPWCTSYLQWQRSAQSLFKKAFLLFGFLQVTRIR